MIAVVIVDDKPAFRVQPGQLLSRAGPTADDLDLNVVRAWNGSFQRKK